LRASRQVGVLNAQESIEANNKVSLNKEPDQGVNDKHILQVQQKGSDLALIETTKEIREDQS